MAAGVINPQVNIFFTDGCGRCKLFATPQCKVHPWKDVLIKLRKIALGCGLTEELKWGVPCYTSENRNIMLIGAFKAYCVISFFKGALLKDKHKLLSKPGENTQAGRVIRITDVQQLIDLEETIRAYIQEAIAIEKSGKQVAMKNITAHAVPEELQHKLKEMPSFKKAFEALTPGRQRGYLIYFAQPKQSATRIQRIEKCVPQIMNGKGLNDR